MQSLPWQWPQLLHLRQWQGLETAVLRGVVVQMIAECLRFSEELSMAVYECLSTGLSVIKGGENMAKGSTQKKPAATKKPTTRNDFIKKRWRGTGTAPLIRKGK